MFGTKIAALLEETETAAPPKGAGPERAIVQMTKLPPMAVGGHVIEVRVLAILICAVAVTPPKVAIRISVPALNGNADAIKVADNVPPTIVTVPGIVRAPELSRNEITTLP